MKLPRYRRTTARTTLLGVAALGLLVWAAVAQLGVNPNTVIAQLLVVFLALVLVMAFAAGTFLLVALLRKLSRRRQ